MRSILNMTMEDAVKFCSSRYLTPFTVRKESAHVIIPDTMKDEPYRVEIEYYLDGNDEYRVGKATVYLNGTLHSVATTDDCDECGGSCDGVHGYRNIERGKTVDELTETILKNDKTIVNEVIRRMEAKQVDKLVAILSAHDENTVADVMNRLKAN